MESFSVPFMLVVICVSFNLVKTQVKTKETLTKWSDWSACEASCRNDTEKVYKYRVRQCRAENCDGELLTMTFECKGIPPHSCPVDAGWNEWSDWTRCSQECGGGETHRSRKCDDPKAANGGRQCSGSHEQLKLCNVTSCPVNCTLKPWSDWTECEDCSRGDKYRRRECLEPKHDGEECPGECRFEKLPCSYDNNICPVDGGWTEWSPDWSACPLARCNKNIGTSVKKRKCTNPKKERGGKDCSGENIKRRDCTTWDDATCPVDASWAAWGNWTKTPPNLKIRSRVCILSRNGGQVNCTGEAKQEREGIVDEGNDDEIGSGSGSRRGIDDEGGSGPGNDDDGGSGHGIDDDDGSGHGIDDDGGSGHGIDDDDGNDDEHGSGSKVDDETGGRNGTSRDDIS